MEKKLGIFVTLFIILNINAIGQKLSDFKALLEECGMNVNIPKGFVESEIIDNKDMSYDYAIKYPDKDFELRYSIRPIRYKKYTNDTLKNEMESQRAFRNSQYNIILETVILNITGGVDYKVQAFNNEAVRKEFNADWGATSFVDLKSDFGKGFKYCMIVTIHKDDFADAYYFYLSNSKDKFSENMDPLFHTLRFD
ncbi:MAG: hypothetical protein LWW85_06585 [Marinilabiliales bacterium]|nr:hypothetical protein [Marinilabiliales bacterium]